MTEPQPTEDEDVNRARTFVWQPGEVEVEDDQQQPEVSGEHRAEKPV